MMRELLERFRYRFQLWRREQSEDYLGSADVEALDVEPLDEREPDYVSFYSTNPKRIIMLKESTIRSVGRFVYGYFGIIIILSWICAWLIRFVPSGRFAIGVLWLALVGFWTLSNVLGTMRLSKAREQYREQIAKSSNPAMELTASRPNA